MYYNVKTIYPAYMGEVNCKGIGSPCVFIRLSGCNLRCYKSTLGTLCDTPEALKMKCGTEMSVDEILLKVAYMGTKLVCLTGGEPLLQDCTELLWALSKMNIHSVIETNGSVSIEKYKAIPNVSFVMDWKSPSSGENNKMLSKNLELLGNNDFLKFVITTEVDYEDMLQVYRLNPTRSYQIAVGIFWGKSLFGYSELIERLGEDNINVYLNCQQHKMCMMFDATRDKINEIFIPKEL